MERGNRNVFGKELQDVRKGLYSISEPVSTSGIGKGRMKARGNILGHGIDQVKLLQDVSAILAMHKDAIGLKGS